MTELTLNGVWTLREEDGPCTVSADVPGDVVAALLSAGKIENPFYRENERAVQWIGEREWIFERDFDVDEKILEDDQIILRCEGLDTLATVQLNGQVVGTADNMHRTYEWNVKSLLVPRNNHIQIVFASVNAYSRKRYQERPFRARVGEGHPDAYPGWVRKEACNFGWDWGPMLVTAGIWRDIRLLGFAQARLPDVRIDQHHTEGAVKLSVYPNVEAEAMEGLRVEARLVLDDDTVASQMMRLDSPARCLELQVKEPKLWWPAGMGEQPLYILCVKLIDARENLVDSQTRRIGLRTLNLDMHPDEWGQSFRFVVNEVPFFAKGANWIPCDAILARRNPKHYRRLIEASAAANMNMIRVWGGGIYEDDCFYDICDELGICVWQDFMFACMAYPAGDEAFRETVAAEAKDNVRRLRHHPCLALWCGNNEVEEQSVGKTDRGIPIGWDEYALIFDQLLPDTVKELDPQRDYWPSSPHSPTGDRADINNPACGDAHLWSVWHGKQPFEWYRTTEHRFCSEFGFQSFPEPMTVYGYTEPQDRNVTTAVMEHHQRSGIGNTTIMQYMLDWFRMPTSFDATLRLSQILQGMAITYAVEHWRRNMPRSMGAIYWQLNDCWPVASWASIDYHARWKALHYMARRFFAPIMVSGVEDKAAGTVEVHITSDRLKTIPATLAWRVTDVAGNSFETGELSVETPVNASRRATTLDLKALKNEGGERNVMVWLELRPEGEEVSTSLVTFVKPKHLELLRDPQIRLSCASGEQGYSVVVESRHPALWAWLELDGLDARFSDNYVHLRPGRPVVVDVFPDKPCTLETLKQRLKASSLVDTYAS